MASLLKQNINVNAARQNQVIGQTAERIEEQSFSVPAAFLRERTRVSGKFSGSICNLELF